MRNLILYFGIILLMFSCTCSKVSTKDASGNSYKVLFESEFGGTGEDELQIITEIKDFNSIWEELTAQPAEEAVGFDSKSEMVLVKSFKSNRTGGGDYVVNDVKQNGSEIQVFYSVKLASTEIGTDVITNPVLVVVVSKVEKPKVEFILQN